VVAAFIGILPQLIVIAIVVVAAILYRRPLATVLQDRLTGFSAFGFRIDLQPREIVEAVRKRAIDAPSGDRSADLDERVGAGIASRARRMAPKLVGRTILWVDDDPDSLVAERELVRRLGMFVEPAFDNDRALYVLKRPNSDVDLVISDIGRAHGAPGTDLPALMSDKRMPVIFYVGRLDPGIPAGAFGITNRPDELLQLIMDAADALPPRS